MAEPGEAGGEIIQPDLHARPVQLVQQLRGDHFIADHRGLGQFQVQARRRQPGLMQALCDQRRQFAAPQLPRRHVDRHEQVVPGHPAWPLRSLHAGRAQHLRADDLDQPALLGHLDEHRWRDRTQGRMLPAQQHLDTDHAAVAHAEDRLVGQAQFAALPGPAQFLLHVHAALDRMVHRPAVVAVAVLAGHLRLVHGDVTVLQQRGRIRRIVREQGHADGLRAPALRPAAARWQQRHRHHPGSRIRRHQSAPAGPRRHRLRLPRGRCAARTAAMLHRRLHDRGCH
ncbi:hypothetical protein G6F22_016296 [Rhizopus arrhizus]|nr:hypothetical protein G6F22_016296 [Rhizopus arrhizus]